MVHHEVERRCAADAATLGVVKLTIVGAWLGLGNEAPVDSRELIERIHTNAKECASWCRAQDWLSNLVEETGLNNGNGEAGLGQSDTHGVTSGASSNDDIVEAVRSNKQVSPLSLVFIRVQVQWRMISAMC